MKSNQRAKIQIVERHGNYVIQAILPDGTVEYPQEGYIHNTKKSAKVAIKAMYGGKVWDLRRGGRRGGWTIDIGHYPQR